MISPGITVVAAVHFSAFGGPHNRTAQVAKALEDVGVRTIIAIPDEPGSAYTRLMQMGLDVRRLPLYRWRKSTDVVTHLRTVANIKRGIQSLKDLVRSENADILALNAINAPHLAAAALPQTAVVWHLIDTYPNPAVRRIVAPLICARADALLVTGTNVLDAHGGMNRISNRTFNFFPSVNMEKFTSTVDRRRTARLKLGIPVDEMVIGTVGNLNPMKGHRLFLNAAARVLRRRPSTRFVILGAKYEQFADYWREMEGLASRLGLLTEQNLIIRDPGAEVADLAPALDIFWMTSEPQSEGIPTAIGEALALEIPVIATDVGSIAECVVDGVTGYVVPPRSADAIVEPTLHLIDDPIRRRAIGKAGRSFASETYSTAVGAQVHQSAYEVALQHRRTIISKRCRKRPEGL